jgi:DNA-binding LacI/PurR family transcriptional regulator
VPRGWANLYFAGQLSGVEEVCRNRGYGLHVNLYDLNNLESFVFPKQVHQRAIDGVILAGYVRSGIVDRFCDFGVPVVCLGENHDVPVAVPIVSVDHVAKGVEAVRHAVAMGHRRIGYCQLPTRQKSDIAQRVRSAIAADPALAGISFDIIVQTSHADTSRSGREVLDRLMEMPQQVRPTVIIFTTLEVPVGVMKEMRRRGWRCPEDLSIIADNDDELCELVDPPMTAMGQDLPLLGRVAANTLIDMLESGEDSPQRPAVTARPLAVRQSVLRINR